MEKSAFLLGAANPFRIFSMESERFTVQSDYSTGIPGPPGEKYEYSQTIALNLNRTMGRARSGPEKSMQ